MASIFQNFWLPNATTWFYFSLLLAIALFFKFSRLLSVRNWDVVTIFLLVPGVLLIEDSQPNVNQKRIAAATVVANFSGQVLAGPAGGVPAVGALVRASELAPKSTLRFGYIWLLAGSAYLLFRCLFDLALVQRPALAPNLNFGGLAWLACALFVCLTAVAFRPESANQPGQLHGPVNGPSATETDPVGRESSALELGQRSLGSWTRRAMAVLCHLIVCIGLIVIARIHFQDSLAGMAAATFYLMLPFTGHYVMYLLHVWPTALIIWALVLYRKPLIAGSLLGLAAGTIYFPVLLFPLWLSFYWGRGAGRFALGFLGTGGIALAVTGIILLWSDDLALSVAEAINSSDWQPWRIPSAEGLWQGIHWAYRIPVFVVFLAFVALVPFWPTPKNLGHVIALSAALLIGVQFWYADKGGQYILWYLPLFLLLIFRPNLSEMRPLPIVPESDWLARSRSRLGLFASWLFQAPETVAGSR